MKNIIIMCFTHILAGLSGYYLMFCQHKKNRKDRKEKIIARVKLIYGDVEKAKNKFEKIRELIGNKEKFTHIDMSTTYFKNIDYDEIKIFLGKTCVEHIRNIGEDVFDKWNKMIQYGGVIPDYSGLKAMVAENINACKDVLNAIDNAIK